ETNDLIVEAVDKIKYEELYQQKKKTYYQTNKLKVPTANLNNTQASAWSMKYTKVMEVEKDQYETSYSSKGLITFSKDSELDNNNDNDDETWYLCNNEIPEDWLGLCNCEKPVATNSK
ncbi:7072_t:CDS:2, partial [Dentiscutata heterogama]